MSPLPPQPTPGSDDPDPLHEPSDDDALAAERAYRIAAVDRVCAILNLLQESVDGVALATIAQVTGLPKSSAFRYLRTLERASYVERDADAGLFRLGLGFAGMQSRSLEVLRERARPWLLRLRDDLGETTNLGILDGDTLIYIDIVESHHDVRLAVPHGRHDPMHSTALGKAIAAELPESRVREILERQGMPKRSANTITTIDAYLDELVKVRMLGYAMDNMENEADGRCVAVAIMGTRPPAAISVSAPASRFPLDDVDRVVTALADAAVRITVAPHVSDEDL